MKEMVLPDELLAGNSFTSNGAYTFFYTSHKPSLKSRIVLDSHLISFLQQGEKAVYYGGGLAKIDSSDFLFLPSGNCLMSEKIADNGAYASILLFFGNDLLVDFFQEYFVNVVAENSGNINRQPAIIQYDDYLRNLVSALKQLQNIPFGQQQVILRLKVKELLLYLCTKKPVLIPYLKGLCHEWTEDSLIRKVVHSNTESSVTIPELAFLCNMSHSTFKRKFSKLFGMAPKQWLFQQRMQNAARMLKFEGQKASEIYQQLGYENLSSFVQAFKQFSGETPKQFQEGKERV